jgi:hypothetical protein
MIGIPGQTYKDLARDILSTLRHFMCHDPTPDYEMIGKPGIFPIMNIRTLLTPQ